MIQRNQTAKDIIKQCIFKGVIELICNDKIPLEHLYPFIKQTEEDLFNIKGETGVKINL